MHKKWPFCVHTAVQCTRNSDFVCMYPPFKENPWLRFSNSSKARLWTMSNLPFFYDWLYRSWLLPCLSYLKQSKKGVTTDHLLVKASYHNRQLFSIFRWRFQLKFKIGRVDSTESTFARIDSIVIHHSIRLACTLVNPVIYWRDGHFRCGFRRKTKRFKKRCCRTSMNMFFYDSKHAASA